MAYSTRKKTTSTVEQIINWAEVSKHLTNSKDAIRKNRIPKVHLKQIELLLTYIEAWKKETKLFSEQELSNSLTEIDLKTIIMGRMGLLD